MAIGRCFEEAFQKALRSLETGQCRLRAVIGPMARSSRAELDAESAHPRTPIASLPCAQRMVAGRSDAAIHDLYAPSTPGSWPNCAQVLDRPRPSCCAAASWPTSALAPC
jgi:hypothetical protein